MERNRRNRKACGGAQTIGPLRSIKRDTISISPSRLLSVNHPSIYIIPLSPLYLSLVLTKSPPFSLQKKTQQCLSKSHFGKPRKPKNLNRPNLISRKMGSCFSKKKEIPSPSAKRHFPQGNPRRGPPPPLIEEEETVKEVLPISETPKKPFPKIEQKPSFPVPETRKNLTVKEVIPTSDTPTSPISDVHPKPASAIPETLKTSFPDIQTKPSFAKLEEEEEKGNGVKTEEKVPTFISADETSEFSEICSASETISTTTIGEKREENGCDEVEMRPKENRSPATIRRKRSYSGDSGGRIERRAKSPARRSDPSPARRTPVLEVGRSNRSRTPMGSNGFRRDTGERRSRSPATRKELGRSPSGRRVAGSPRRNPTEATENVGRKVEEGASSPAAAAAAPSASKESLENPLVSLECFIFL